MKRARAVQDVDYPDGEWSNMDGRPRGSGTAEAKVQQYRREHPEANVTEVARALGISRTTVYKWWDVSHGIHVKIEPSEDVSDFLVAMLRDDGED